MIDLTVVFEGRSLVYLGLDGGRVVAAEADSGVVRSLNADLCRIVPTRKVVDSVVQRKGVANTAELGTHSVVLQLIDPGPHSPDYCVIVERRVYS